ncbi:hypothetical protein [Arcobacter sp. s6]|jgi:uncharacterized protein YlzI (FlbEa/FlbD family)|uniref:hypothetical protein n=1 Tax=Arcobacter sp. s6 TaxID=3230363 RepID=UPI0034A08814
MAKGKKTLIKEIKKLDDDILLINGKEYVIVEDTENIETATTMKISSNGNRILRFEDEKKKATIDVKRDIDIVKYTFLDASVAKKFAKGYDKSVITKDDKREEIGNASSFVKARKIINTYISKNGENYDPKNGKTTFYVTEEA